MAATHNSLGLAMPALGGGALNLPVQGDISWQHVTRATATLPQTAASALFTITGGRIMLVAIIGEVTTVIQTQANNTKLVFNPTAAGASTDLCAVLSTTALAVGTLLSITGTLATAMQSGVLMTLRQATPLILSEGTIDLDCAASNTGSVKWDLFYVPLSDDATLSLVAAA